MIVESGCKRDGWSLFHNKCIKYFQVWKTWSEAKDICQSNDATLISIHSKQENDFVCNLVKKHSYFWVWIGGKRNSYNRFEWINGKAFNYTNWESSQPDGGHYVAMYGTDGKWYDWTAMSASFLCEYIRTNF